MWTHPSVATVSVSVTVPSDPKNALMAMGLGMSGGFIDSMPLQTPSNALPESAHLKLLDLGCAPYVLYGIEYIDLVSL